MAFLCRAIQDEHLFIIGGKSQGTWHVTAQGESWLKKHMTELQFPWPTHPGDRVHIPGAVYNRMRKLGFLTVTGERSTSTDPDTTMPSPHGQGVAYLPLKLRVDDQGDIWGLHLQLPQITQRLLGQARTALISIATATLPLRDLVKGPRHLPVAPSSAFYRVHVSRVTGIEMSPYLPGAPGMSHEHGEVFYQSQQFVSHFARCIRDLPILDLADWRTYRFWWVGPTTLTCLWPGEQRQVGLTQNGWQCRALLLPQPPGDDEACKDWLAFYNTKTQEGLGESEMGSIPHRKARVTDVQYQPTRTSVEQRGIQHKIRQESPRGESFPLCAAIVTVPASVDLSGQPYYSPKDMILMRIEYREPVAATTQAIIEVVDSEARVANAQIAVSIPPEGTLFRFSSHHVSSRGTCVIHIYEQQRRTQLANTVIIARRFGPTMEPRWLRSRYPFEPKAAWWQYPPLVKRLQWILQQVPSENRGLLLPVEMQHRLRRLGGSAPPKLAQSCEILATTAIPQRLHAHINDWIQEAQLRQPHSRQ